MTANDGYHFLYASDLLGFIQEISLGRLNDDEWIHNEVPSDPRLVLYLLYI